MKKKHFDTSSNNLLTDLEYMRINAERERIKKYQEITKDSAYKYYKISKYHHMTKAETCLIEAKNSIIRNYLARFNRATKRYSKAIRMIHASLTMLFWKDMLDLNFYL
jgi:IS1 family transposase